MNVAVACEARLMNVAVACEVRSDVVVASVVAVMSFDLGLDSYSSVKVASGSAQSLGVTALEASLEDKHHHLIGDCKLEWNETYIKV